MTTQAQIDRAAQRPSLAASLASIFAYRELIRNLVLKDLTLKYRGSMLGFLWSLINPVADFSDHLVDWRRVDGVFACQDRMGSVNTCWR